MSSPMKALHRLLKKRIRQKPEDDSNLTSPDDTIRKQTILSDNIEGDDEDILEQFFSDEEPKLSVEVEETPEVIVKKLSKRVTKINLAMNTCTRNMDYNFDLLKKYLKEGKSNNPENAKLRQQVTQLAGVFEKSNPMRNSNKS